MANVIINDPLLGGAQNPYQQNMPATADQQLAYLNEMQQRLDTCRQYMQHAPVPGTVPPPPATSTQQTQASRTPVWDEIEKLSNDFSDEEFRLISEHPDFVESQNTITTLITREQMRMLRPMVEGTKDGKEALDNHLIILKRLKKQVKAEADKRLELMTYYMTNYPDMPYTEYLKMKRDTTDSKKPSKK